MLPTEKAISINQICLLKEGKLHISTGGIGDLSCNRYHYQHLYFLSDDVIEEGDWFINVGVNGNSLPYQYPKFLKAKCSKKIICTTDSSLVSGKGLDSFSGKPNLLPRPSEDFIKVFVEEFNKGNQIEWVDVEYEDATEYDRVYNKEKYFPRLKVNSKNEITIRKIKDTWTRDEVIALLHNMPFDIDLHYGQGIFNKWIEENL